jgi:predicted RNase H-like HicB family nuclease
LNGLRSALSPHPTIELARYRQKFALFGGRQFQSGEITPDKRPSDIRRRYTGAMARKVSVVIEKDESGFYAWCPELKGCQSQGNALEETLVNIKEAIELYLETLPAEERDVLLSREILTTTVEVNA